MSRQELLGIHPWDISPEYQEDRALSKDKAAVMIKEAEVHGFHRFNWIHQNGEGDKVYAEVVLTVIESNGQASVYFVTWRDKTLGKHIEIENNRLSNRLKLATQIGGIGTWIWQPHTQEFEWDEQMHVIFELDKYEDDLLKAWQQRVVDEDYERLILEMQEAMEAGRDFESDYRIRLENDEIKYLTTVGRPFMNPSTQQQMVLGIVVDNTKHFHMLEALREREMLLKTATSNAKIGMWDWRIKDDVVVFNEEWANMCGYTLDELKPSTFRTWESLSHPDDFKYLKKRLEKHLAGETDYYECESRLKHKAGHWIWVLDRGKVVEWNSNYEPIRMIGTHTDITKLKEAKLSLNEARKKAEKVAIKAEEANEAKSSYLAHISHEIRTPLNGMIGFLDILKQTIMTSEQESYLQQTESAANVLLKLVNDLLDYSKLEVRKIELDLQVFDLREILEETIRFFSVKASEKELYLSLYIDPELPYKVKGDPIRLRQILYNILSNSFKFTQQGFVKVHVSVKEEQVLIKVSDSGIGMTQKTLDQLFTPFMQANQSISSEYGGTGLGLSISKMLVELMKGQIDVESHINEGTDIVITLNFDVVERVDPKVKDYQKLKTSHILLIGHHYEYLETMKAYLSDFTQDITRALETDFEEKLEQDYEFIIVQGFGLKKMYSLLQRIHEEVKFSNTRLLLWLSEDKKSKLTDTMISIVDGIIVNPINYHEMLDEMYMMNKKDEKEFKKDVMKIDDLSLIYRPKILIAEDNEINQRLLMSYLNRRGLSCDVAHNGLEALEAFEKVFYDIVLMDCQMPVMDGYEATQKIRTKPSGKDVQIVALTAHANKEDELKCLRAGMDKYMSKPVSFKKLDIIIDEYIRSLIGKKDKLVIYDNAMNRLIEKTTLHKETIETLVEEFIDSAQEKCIEMRELCLDSDFESLLVLVHEVRGTANNLHMNEVAERMDALLTCVSVQDQEGCMKYIEMTSRLIGLNE